MNKYSVLIQSNSCTKNWNECQIYSNNFFNQIFFLAVSFFGLVLNSIMVSMKTLFLLLWVISIWIWVKPVLSGHKHGCQHHLQGLNQEYQGKIHCGLVKPTQGLNEIIPICSYLGYFLGYVSRFCATKRLAWFNPICVANTQTNVKIFWLIFSIK